MAKKGHKLNDEQKRFIVQRLACFDTPGEVAEAVKEEFGLKVGRQTVHHYDPTKKSSPHLAQQWRDLFEKTRQDFLKDTQNHIPIANKAVRLREMQKAYWAHRNRGNWVGAMQVLEQAAKEVGNVHTNRREISGRDGKPIEYADMSREQLDAEVAQLLRSAGISVVTGDEDEANAGDGSNSVH